MSSPFIKKCLNETLRGLREGLTKFSGPSSAAAIFILKGDPTLFIYDPDKLLHGHEPKLKKFYFGKNDDRNYHRYNGISNCYSAIENVPELQIDGLLSFGGSSATVPYQMWFTENHPDLSSPGPTERWLEHAVLRFSHDVANDAELYTGISGRFLKEYSTHAIHDHITAEAPRLTGGSSSTLDFYPILEAVLAISKTREEGTWPSGELVFVPPSSIDDITFMARFIPSELPRLDHPKHVRKLLQSVDGTDHKLISDGANILGVAYSRLPDFSLTADYHGHYGFLRLNENAVCSFSDGRYRSSSLRAKLYEIEEILLDFDMDQQTRDNLFYIFSVLVHNGQSMKHGCTFVLDLNETPTKISGQLLQFPLDLNNPDFLELACGFSRVDGALHICRDQKLHSFACLLDGRTIAGEDRARGARYNSALRFTAENPQTVVVVVSSDRPVSVIQDGLVVDGHCPWQPPPAKGRLHAPQPLEQWLAASE